MKLNRKSSVIEGEYDDSEFYEAKHEGQGIQLKKSDFLSKRESVVQKRLNTNNSVFSINRDSSSNTSLNKSRRGRSHRKSRKQSQEQFQQHGPSNDSKVNKIASYSELLNRSIEEPTAIQK
jgi:hypothetical protein